MLSRTNEQTESSDEEDYIKITINQEDSPDQSARLLININSPATPASSEFKSTPKTSPSRTPSPTYSLSSPLSSIRFMMFTPTPILRTPTPQPKISLRDKLQIEKDQVTEVLGMVRTSLESNMENIVKYDFTLEQLKSLASQVDAGEGKELIQAIDQQKRHFNRLRWTPYLPSVVVLFPLIPPIWKLPTAIIFYLFGKKLDDICFTQYEYELKKLEEIANFQGNLFEKKNKAIHSIERLDALSTPLSEVSEPEFSITCMC